MRQLHPAVLPTFEKAGVSQILHAGDISIPSVLRQLEEVAPVLAVRGNRDWFLNLPMQRTLQIQGTRIGLVHGHGNWASYLRDKARFIFRGPQTFEFFMKRAMSLVQNVDVLVFGHNHEPMVKKVNGLLVVNPGSACCQAMADKLPTVGLLRVDGGIAQAEIVELKNKRG